MKRAAALLVFTAMIAACDGTPPTDANGEATTAEAEQFPTRAAGKWRTTSIASGFGQREVQTACFPEIRIDEAQQLTPVFPAHDCDFKLNVTPKSVIVEEFCRDGEQRMDSRTVITGDFSKRYTADTKFLFLPAVQGKGQVNVITTAERIGDC